MMMLLLACCCCDVDIIDLRSNTILSETQETMTRWHHWSNVGQCPPEDIACMMSQDIIPSHYNNFRHHYYHSMECIKHDDSLDVVHPTAHTYYECDPNNILTELSTWAVACLVRSCLSCLYLWSAINSLLVQTLEWSQYDQTAHLDTAVMSAAWRTLCIHSQTLIVQANRETTLLTLF